MIVLYFKNNFNKNTSNQILQLNIFDQFYKVNIPFSVVFGSSKKHIGSPLSKWTYEGG